MKNILLFVIVASLMMLIQSQTAFVSRGRTQSTFRVWTTDSTSGKLSLLQAGTIQTSLAANNLYITSMNMSSDGLRLYIGDSLGNLRMYTRNNSSGLFALSSSANTNTSTPVYGIEQTSSTSTVTTYSGNGGKADVWSYLNKVLVKTGSRATFPSSNQCTAFDNSTFTTSTPTYVWNNSNSNCIINCNTALNTDTSATVANQVNICKCKTYYFWNGKYCQLQMQYSCSIVAYASTTSSASAGTCACQTGFYWEAGGCQVACDLRPNTAGRTRDSAIVCNCVTGYNWKQSITQCITSACYSQTQCPGLCGYYSNSTSDNVCVPNCMNGVPYATAYAVNNGSTSAIECVCATNFTWNNISCVRDCSLVANSAGLDTSTNTTCLCATNYYWNSALNSCVLPNCSSVQNSAGSFDFNSYTCQCVNTSYIYSSGSCTLDCYALANTNGNANAAACTCVSSYTWDTITSSCKSTTPLVNCSAINNTDGYNSNSATTNPCNCKTGFYWNNTLGSIGGCQIDCSKVTAANATANDYTCTCNSGYYWNSSALKCFKNCSQQLHTFGYDPNLPTQCKCKYNIHKDNSQKCLILNCSQTKYTKKANTRSNGSCYCSSGYRWDKIIWDCVPSKSNSTAIAVAVSLSVIFGLLLLAALAYYCCVYRKKNANPSTAIAAPPATSTNIVTTTVTTSNIPQYSNPRISNADIRGSGVGVPIPPQAIRNSVANYGTSHFPPDLRTSNMVPGPPPPNPYTNAPIHTSGVGGYGPRIQAPRFTGD